MDKYVPGKKIKETPLVLIGPKGALIALGGTVIRPAKPPVRPEVVIKEATASQYEWAYRNGHSGIIDLIKEEKTTKAKVAKEENEE